MRAMRSAALAALLIPATMLAQQPAAPAGGPLTGAFRNATMGRQRILAQAFDSIPASLFNYKPTPEQLTIGYIAQHLADDNYGYCGRFGAMTPTRAAKDTATADSIKATWPRDTLIAQLKESFKFCEDAFAQLDDAKLSEMVSIKLRNGQTRDIARVQFVLGHVTDMADHYSQIANYMRLNHMLPPTALPRPGRGGRGGQ